MRAHRYGLPLAAVAAVAAVGVATLLLRPRGGLIEAAAVEPTAYFSAEQLERAREYSGPQRLIALGGLALSGATLALLALRPPRALRSMSERLAGRPLLGGAAIGAGILVVLAIVTLPLGAVAHERAVDVGLSTQSFGPWLGDQGKSAAIAGLLAGAGGLVAVALVRRFPRHWWAPAGAVVVAASVALTYAAPLVIDPLFNRFDRLPDGELRTEVLELAERAEVEVGEVYRVDASRRTTASNAYVGGLGETKRVVLYDNLLEDLPPDQVRSVVAHELAHVSYDDVPRGLLWVAIVALPSMLLVQRLTERFDRGRPAGARAGSTPAAGAPARGIPALLPALALSLALVSFGGQIAGNWLSRQVEARADAFALELTNDPAAFVGLQRSLAAENVSEPDPPQLLHDLFGTHPTTVERIGFGLGFARER
jgi:STE24 endopeptidase